MIESQKKKIKYDEHEILQKLEVKIPIQELKQNGGKVAEYIEVPKKSGDNQI